MADKIGRKTMEKTDSIDNGVEQEEWRSVMRAGD